MSVDSGMMAAVAAVVMGVAGRASVLSLSAGGAR